MRSGKFAIVIASLSIAMSVVSWAPVADASVPPSSLQATARSSSTVDLRWTDPNTDEKSYVIQRSFQPTSGFATVGSVGANVTTYQDQGLPASTTVYYRVGALSTANTYSGWSNVATTTTFAAATSSTTTATPPTTTVSSASVTSSGSCSAPSSPPPGRYVDPSSGVDSDTAGTSARPWRTLKYALARLNAGDTLWLRGGTYFETSLVASRSGTASQPIVIQGYPCEKAIVDSGYPDFRTPNNADWELVNASLGEYRSVRSITAGTVYAYVAGIPGYENERMALVPYVSADKFRATTDQYVDAVTPFYVGPGTFKDVDGRLHIRLAKTPDFRATEARYGTVLASENADPRRYSIIVSQGSKTLNITGAYITVRDVVFNQGQNTVSLAAGAHHVNLDRVTVWIGDHGVAATGAGVHDVTLTRSRIYGDAPYWIFWSDMKDSPAPADLMRSTSIDLRYGAYSWEIAYNHVRGSGQDLFSTNTDEHDVSIHHNRFENCGDDAFEIEGTTNVGRMWVYENYIGNCLTGIAPGQATPRFDGPLYVFRNVFALLRNPPVNRKAGINTWNGGGRFGYEYAFKQHSANTHYYHNTVVLLNARGSGVNLVPGTPDNTYVANNLLVMVNGLVQGKYLVGAGQIVDGDLYWKMNNVDTAHLVSSYDTVPALRSAIGLEAHGLGAVVKRGTDPRFATFAPAVNDRSQPVWTLPPSAEVYKPSDFFLASASPAIGTGIVIPVHPTLGTMPDTRSSRDIGAIPSTANPADYDVFPFVPTASP